LASAPDGIRGRTSPEAPRAEEAEASGAAETETETEEEEEEDAETGEEEV
jgi:hypothetical protein